MSAESKGDVSRTRTDEQRIAYEGTVGQGLCPFCGTHEEMSEEIRSRMIAEGLYWRAWHNPFPYPGHAAHIVLAPIAHWTQPADITPGAALEWVALTLYHLLPITYARQMSPNAAAQTTAADARSLLRPIASSCSG